MRKIWISKLDLTGDLKLKDWGLGTSALWDNRVSQHCAVWDYAGEEPRHGTRVSSLAEVPFFDPESKSQREALGLALA
jgi:hypothetical protein